MFMKYPLDIFCQLVFTCKNNNGFQMLSGGRERVLLEQMGYSDPQKPNKSQKNANYTSK